ncbi:retrovirus-related pol polyprotein from transposon TNT 1-94, partial [Tanacetum coccineum]
PKHLIVTIPLLQDFRGVTRLEAIGIFLDYAAYMGFMVYQMDVHSAFLNGKILEEVYVQQPPGFESGEFPNHVYKLDKALYELKQAPRAWYETLSNFLIQHKFVRCTIDNTLFTYKTKSDVIIVQIYVDDIIFGPTSSKLSKQFRKLMTKKYEISMIGELTYFLGFQIKPDFKGISICQKKYVKDLLKKYDLADYASVKCFMLPPNNLGRDESGVSVNETLFRGMIGSLMYLTASRPDIQFSTCLYARYQANPKESHLVAVKRIFRYLKGTPNLGLWHPKGSGFDLKAYSDSDYARCNLDRKSTSGGCQILRGKLVCWSAKKQSSVAMSSAEAENVGKILSIARALTNFTPWFKEFIIWKGSVFIEVDCITFCAGLRNGFIIFTKSCHSAPKTPTDLKTKKKRIPPSSKPKSPYKVRVILPKKQVAETQHTEVTVATADATKSLVASELAEEQVNQPSAAEAEKVLDQNVKEEVKDVGFVAMEEIKTIKSYQAATISGSLFIHQSSSYDQDKDAEEGKASESLSGLRYMPADYLASISGFETQDSADHVSEEAADMKSSIPAIVVDILKEQLSGLLSDALKDTLPRLINNSIKSSVSTSIAEELPQVEAHIQKNLHDQLPNILLKSMYKEFNAFNKLES